MRKKITTSVAALLLMASANAQAVIWNVSDQDELNAAIADYNTQNSGSHTLNINSDITLTANTATISNQSFAGATLNIVGNNSEIDGAGSYRILELNTTTRVTIGDLTFKNGRADRGGAISIVGTGSVSIYSSTFTANQSTTTATSSGDANAGGGGAIFSTSGSVTVGTSYFANNSSAKVGGAIAIYGGTLYLNQSTLYNNSVPNVVGGFGGGVYVSSANGAALDMTGSTLSGNTAGGGPAFGENLNNNGGAVIVSSSIIFNGSCKRANIGTFSAEYSMFPAGNNERCGVIDGVDNNQVGVDPLLTGPVDRGGNTLVLAIPANSPARNAGHNVSIENNVDQRLQKRGQAVDVGAFEFIAADALEVNDSIASATEVSGNQFYTELNLDDEMRNGVNDIDTFKMYLPADQEFIANALFFHVYGDLDMRLKNSNDETVATSVTITNNETISYTPSESGDHYLEVYGFSSDRNDYALELTVPSDGLCFPVKAQNDSVAMVCL